MKIRNGFVSNSSSSSFIIAIGKITDKQKFLDEAKKFNLDEWSYELNEYDGNIDQKVESFTCNELSLGKYKGLKAGDIVVKITYFGNEGDSFFMNEYDNDINYNIDWDDFNNSITKFLDNCKSIENLEISYGAARNG